MREFFASLRRLLAYVDLERLNLGSVVHQMIREVLIPKLEKMAELAKTDVDRDRIDRLIAEYKKYSDTTKSESKIFSKSAATVVRQLAARGRIDESEMEDLMQQLAMDFFQPLKAGGAMLLDPDRFNVMGGPLALNKLWMHVVDMRTRYRIRETHRKNPYLLKKEESTETDEGEMREDPVERVQAPSRVDESYIRQVMKDLVGFMHSHLRSQEKIGVFDKWMEVAQEKGADRVDMKHDVYAALQDEGYTATPSTMAWWWLEIKKLIVQFFDKELEGEVSGQVRRMLRVSSIDILAYEQFRRQFAAWILGGILKAMIEEEKC